VHHARVCRRAQGCSDLVVEGQTQQILVVRLEIEGSHENRSVIVDVHRFLSSRHGDERAEVDLGPLFRATLERFGLRLPTNPFTHRGVHALQRGCSGPCGHAANETSGRESLARVTQSRLVECVCVVSESDSVKKI
jgi:hypothetical protein